MAGWNGNGAWHALGVDEALAAAASHPERGLSADEASARAERFGPNALPWPPRRSHAGVFLSQFRSPLVYLLFGAALLSLALGHLGDAVIILVVVVLNAAVGTLQEGRAERALEALRGYLRQSVRVVRDGEACCVDAGGLVPGDVLLLEAGEAVPADARLIEAASLQLAEAVLTGESLPVDKAAGALDATTPLPERRNMLYAGTHVTAGRARALVVATGSATESGRVAQLAEAAEPPKTPLERRIHAFGQGVIWASGVTFVGITTLGLLRGMPLGEIALVGVSQVVSMVPEGLPVAVTVALAVGVQRMAQRRAVVRRLSAIETLGATTVICADKTGTLTRNELTATTVVLPGGRTLRVAHSAREAVPPAGDRVEQARDSGAGAPRGEVPRGDVAALGGGAGHPSTAPEERTLLRAGAPSAEGLRAHGAAAHGRDAHPSPTTEERTLLRAGAPSADPSSTRERLAPRATGPSARASFTDEAGLLVVPLELPGARALLEAAVLCNDAAVLERGNGAGVGDPTELALVRLGVQAGLDVAGVRGASPRLEEIPFDAGTRWMVTRHAPARAILKGAPEAVLALCALSEEARTEWSRWAEAHAAEALRMMAFADLALGVEAPLHPEAHRAQWRMLGLVGQVDPPRPEVPAAIARARSAGIHTVMLTGDHRVTGTAVGRALGLLGPNDEVMDGEALDQLPDAALDARIRNIAVFARVQPAQKIRIVRAWQRAGAVVAMTGDGVNDAPALVQADVGVAMGKGGTAAAREASRVVLTDDNFATLVAAVEEGRVVYRNIQKLLLYLLSTSVAEVLILVAALLAGYLPPLAAVQILWINLVTDGLMTVTLILEPAEGDELSRPPVPRASPLVTRSMLQRMAFLVPAITVAVLGWYVAGLAAGRSHGTVRTETFTVLALCQWFNALNCRSGHESTLGRSLLRNPWIALGVLGGMLLHAAVIYLPPLARMFHAEPFHPPHLLGLLGAASLVLWVEELRKWAVRRRAGGPSQRRG